MVNLTSWMLVFLLSDSIPLDIIEQVNVSLISIHLYIIGTKYNSNDFIGLRILTLNPLIFIPFLISFIRIDISGINRKNIVIPIPTLPPTPIFLNAANKWDELYEDRTLPKIKIGENFRTISNIVYIEPTKTFPKNGFNRQSIPHIMTSVHAIPKTFL